jgi:hypothetical protein
MRVIAYTVVMCVLLSGAALAKNLLASISTPAEKLGSVYLVYLEAQQCSARGLSFKADDLTKIFVFVKTYAEQSGVPKTERNEQWENAKKRSDRMDVNTDDCRHVRSQLSHKFPGVLPKTSDNPF